jgi:hypothetical protein
MTDGENCAAYGDAYKSVFGLCSSSSARDKMNARAEKLAANIKATGVVIYVVQFVEDSSTLKAFLKKVASGRTRHTITMRRTRARSRERSTKSPITYPNCACPSKALATRYPSRGKPLTFKPAQAGRRESRKRIGSRCINKRAMR